MEPETTNQAEVVIPTEEITITESEAAKMEENAMTQEQAIEAGLDVDEIEKNAVEVRVVPDSACTACEG